jgi:hypothetical protein
MLSTNGPWPTQRPNKQTNRNKVNRRFTGRELNPAVAAADDETER